VVATSQQLGTGSAAPSPTFTDNLSFTPLGRTTPATLPAGNVAVFDVSSASGTCAAAGGDMRCLRVVVTAAGQIRMCDPAVPATSTDPRKC
jgi:type IV fimbrial biogenesis protein FimT